MRDVRVPDGYRLRLLGAVEYVVIHHSGVNYDSDAEGIERYHRERLGWPGGGYHFVIRWNGDIEMAGDLATVRYNVAGRNAAVVGVCLPGNFDGRIPTEEQIGATRNLLAVLVPVLDPTREGLVRVVGHRDIALAGYGTECPGNTWGAWKWNFA